MKLIYLRPQKAPELKVGDRLEWIRPSPSLMPPDKAAAARAVACMRLKKKG